MKETIEKTLEPYEATRPVHIGRKLNDEEIENGLYWVSDAVRGSHLGVALGYQAVQHFANDVLPEQFWMGVEESRTGMTEG